MRSCPSLEEESVEWSDVSESFYQLYRLIFENASRGCVSVENASQGSEPNGYDVTSLQTMVHRIQKAVATMRARMLRHSLGCVFSNFDQSLSSLRRLVRANNTTAPAVVELVQLFNRPHMKALFTTLDRIMHRHYGPNLPDVPHEVDEDEGMAVKIVRLIKNNEPLGATLKLDERTGALLIARILHGCAADRSGCINVGDQVVEVNGVSVVGKQPSDVVNLLNNSNEFVTFKLIPAIETSPQTSQPKADIANDNEPVYLKALFNYNALEDQMNPCPEASLTFKRGDILRLFDTNDENWWQAKIEGEINGRVGLIPSKNLIYNRHLIRRRSKGSNTMLNLSTSRKVRYCTKAVGDVRQSGHGVVRDDDADVDCIRTYETVALYKPDGFFRRPLVLIGAPGVGRGELKRRLLACRPDTFAATVPYTSRQPRTGETDGVEYCFTSRAQMEHWIRGRRLIEYGEFQGNLYGTTLDSVERLICQRRVCILNPHPRAIALLRCAQLKPYFVFVRPPEFSSFKATRRRKRPGLNAPPAPDVSERDFADDELQLIIEQSDKLESTFGHYFDHTLVNGHIDLAVLELLNLVAEIESQPQWVPADWIV
ncbi:MAGUK p55 subfamily member 7 [Trichinella pseudospiralis]|uniref:MAGUK p55 subfamily member 7 n=1 Tax=Trichinella pseudospiralis TaxID=6337 RepID=A0A0V1E9R3_TRIPS|nr:MAGUK p55 subfamily member 7 [Trichinella pseudospiralis]KRZ34813.1 MAGUK p55 subfamily member 7 [Trichinella pseudospiralis]KRZ38012.1 MAGUK p55 subfamily member 7 [Trichinella pseudospiralis]